MTIQTPLQVTPGGPGGVTEVTTGGTYGIGGGANPTNVGTLSNSTGNGYTNTDNSSWGDNRTESYIPDYEPQLGFLEQYGNMAGDLASNQYDWAQDQFQNNSDLTNQNINSYLEQSDLASTAAQRDYANYNDIFNPAAASLTDDWQSYASPDRISAEMGAAEAGTAQSFESQRANAERDLQSYGLNPGDPRYQGATQASRTAQAAASAGAGVKARLATENTARNLRGDALQVASQLPGQQATAQNTAMQGYTGASNAAFGNTSLGSLTMGNTPGYLAAGISDVKFQPMGNAGHNVTGSVGTTRSANNSNSTSGPVLNTTPYAGFHYMAEGGAIPDDGGGGYVPPDMSPSGGQQTDDIPAVINQTGGQARLNADEFVIPQDINRWYGQKFFQDLILKARKAMGDANQAPAHPTMGPGGVQQHAAGGDINTPMMLPTQYSGPGGGDGPGGMLPPTPGHSGPDIMPRPPAPALPGQPGGINTPMTHNYGGSPTGSMPPPPAGGGGGGSGPVAARGGVNPGQAGSGSIYHTASGAIPTMSDYRGGAGTMSNGGGQYGGRYGFGISGGGIGARSAPGQKFTPKSSYASQQNPFKRMTNPGWNKVTAPRPTERADTEKNLNLTGGGTGTTGGTGGTGGTAGVGGSKNYNNDGRLHPMLPNDLDQLLTDGAKISQQNADVYAKHGIQMPTGTYFGTPSNPITASGGGPSGTGHTTEPGPPAPAGAIPAEAPPPAVLGGANPAAAARRGRAAWT